MSAIFFPFVAMLHRRAVHYAPKVEALCAQYMQAQSAVEDADSPGPDAAAHPTAQLMAELLSAGAMGDKQRILHRLGYFLGRWIYFMDAADDLEGDSKSGDFNPFLKGNREDLSQTRKRIEGLLNSCLYEISAAFVLFDPDRFGAELQNIVTLGLPAMQKRVLEGKRQQEQTWFLPNGQSIQESRKENE